MKSNYPITLIPATDDNPGCFTNWPVIAVQLENVELFDPIPSHITVRDSKYYGHYIYESREVKNAQFLHLSDEPDAKWLAKNPLNTVHLEPGE